MAPSSQGLEPPGIPVRFKQQQAEIQEIRHQLRDILADALSHNSTANTEGGVA